LEDFYIEKLMWFKQNEKPETVLVVADQPDRLNIVISWTNLEVKRNDKLMEPVGESENEIWHWLWDNTHFNLSDLKSKTGVPYIEAVLENEMKPLIGNRVLYPDGTLNSYVQRYIRESVLRLFQAKPRKAIRRTED
jgi:hypothetical protein